MTRGGIHRHHSARQTANIKKIMTHFGEEKKTTTISRVKQHYKYKHGTSDSVRPGYHPGDNCVF